MPNPKRRHSKARRDKRRAHDHLKPPGLSLCPNCHEPKLSAPRLPALRPLQGQARDGSGGGLSAAVPAPRRPAVAVDALGGDHGPRVVVEGAVAACRELGLRVLLVGPGGHRGRGAAPRGRRPACPSTVVDAPDAVGMAETVTRATLKKRSSIQVALEQVRDGAADAFFSAGQHRRLLDDRQADAGHARGGRPARAGRGRAAPDGPHRAARRGRQRELQGAPPRGVRGDGQGLHRAPSSTSAEPARRAS